MCGANALPERVHVIELLTDRRWDYWLSSFWIDEFRLMVVRVCIRESGSLSVHY